LERNIPKNLTLEHKASTADGKGTQLDILVHHLGRINFGCIWDFKGLVFPDVKLNGASLTMTKNPPCPLCPDQPLHLSTDTH